MMNQAATLALALALALAGALPTTAIASPAFPAPPQAGAQPKASAPRPAVRVKQTPAPPAAAPPPAATVPSGPEVKRRNVNIEVTIADQAGAAPPVKKVVTMIVADRQMGSVRSNGSVMVQTGGVAIQRPVTLNVDATPITHPDDSVLLSLTVEYRPTAEGATDGENAAQLNERLSVTLESGKPLVISRATDPAGNRKIVMEVTATVMR